MEKENWTGWHKLNATKSFVNYLINKKIHWQKELVRMPNIAPEKYSELKGRYDEVGDLIGFLDELLNQNEQQIEGE